MLCWNWIINHQIYLINFRYLAKAKELDEHLNFNNATTERKYYTTKIQIYTNYLTLQSKQLVWIRIKKTIKNKFNLQDVLISCGERKIEKF